MTRISQRFGQKDKVQEATEVLTLIYDHIASLSGATHNPVSLDATVTDIFDIGAGTQVLSSDTAVVRGDIIIADSNPNWTPLNIGAANTVLFSDGTDPSWAVAAENLPVTPSGRGYILRSNATPAWEEHLANTDGAAIYGDGTDVLSSLTPTFKGIHTHTANIVMDDGAGNSPEVHFIGGSNDDDMYFYLEDDAVAGQSDLILRLADDGGQSWFTVEDSGGADQMRITSNGTLELTSQIRGLSDNDTYIWWFGADRLQIAAGGVTFLDIAEDAADTITLGGDGVIVPDEYYIGLSSTTGRFTFDSTPTPDIIRVKNADLVMVRDDGTDILTIRRSGDVSGTQADFYAHYSAGLAADHRVGMFIDAENASTTRYFAVLKDDDDFTNATEIMRVNEAGELYLNDTANADMTQGITINQGANDDEIFALKSSDVGHGMTDFGEADTYGAFQKAAAAAGGLQILGLRDADGAAGNALTLRGFLDEEAIATKTTGTIGIVTIDAAITDAGTGKQAVGANGNLVVMRNDTTTRWILDADGDIFYGGADDGAIADDEDDVMLLTGLRALKSPEGSPARRVFHGFLDDAEASLIKAGVLTAPLVDGGLTSRQGLDGLLIDALRQLYCRIENLEMQIAGA